MARNLEYFKDNIVRADEDNDFDASEYYYNREGSGVPSSSAEPCSVGVGIGGASFSAAISNSSGSGIFVGNSGGGVMVTPALGGGVGDVHTTSQHAGVLRAIQQGPASTGGLGSDTKVISGSNAGVSNRNIFANLGSGAGNSIGSDDMISSGAHRSFTGICQGEQGVQPSGDLAQVFGHDNDGNQHGAMGGGIGSSLLGGQIGVVEAGRGISSDDSHNFTGGHGTNTAIPQDEMYSVVQESAPFGAEDFPALGGVPGSGRGNTIRSLGDFTPGDSAMHGGHQDLRGSEFSGIMSEDAFPALPGSGGHGSVATNGQVLIGTSGGTGVRTSGGAFSSSTGVNPGLGDYPQKVSPIKMDGRDGGGSDVHGSSKSGAQRDALHKQYGLLGLLSVIQMTDPDRNALALGSDLTTLGLNLNSSKSLYSKFSSPWVDGHSATEPQFNLPSCYHMQTPPPLKHAHLQKFQLETLFLIFYSMPKDILQAYAAQELYHRDWRYHTDLKLWFRRATPQDLPQVHADRAQSQFVFFDINSWECRLFSGIAHVVSAGLMSEEDVNVRLPTHSS